MLWPSLTTNVVIDCIFSACVCRNISVSQVMAGFVLQGLYCIGNWTWFFIDKDMLSLKQKKKETEETFEDKLTLINYREQGPVLYFCKTQDWLGQAVSAVNG